MIRGLSNIVLRWSPWTHASRKFPVEFHDKKVAGIVIQEVNHDLGECHIKAGDGRSWPRSRGIDLHFVLCFLPLLRFYLHIGRTNLTIVRFRGGVMMKTTNVKRGKVEILSTETGQGDARPARKYTQPALRANGELGANISTLYTWNNKFDRQDQAQLTSFRYHEPDPLKISKPGKPATRRDRNDQFPCDKQATRTTSRHQAPEQLEINIRTQIKSNTTRCPNCKSRDRNRISRTWWMRLLPGSRYYQCYRCYQQFLRWHNHLFSR